MEDDTVTIRVGKNGVTKALTEEVRCILRKHKKARVKMLKTSLGTKDKHDMADEIRKSCKARKAKLIGHTIL
ncbi:MAG: YhbY family RNA-binding protein, partial [Candidatus Altiarchaeota archaeon]